MRSAQIRDLDADGKDELCLSFYIRQGVGSYKYETIVYDPMNGYQEKFRMTLEDHQFIPYTEPLRYGGVGVDIDGDGSGEFLMVDYEWVGENEGQYQVQIRDGATGAIEWSKQYSRGVNIAVEWAEASRLIGDLTRISTDVTGNGELNFGIGETQTQGEELIAGRFTLFEIESGQLPELSITVETDAPAYAPQDTIELRIGCKNTGMDVYVDVYVAMVTADGKIHCAPSWAPGITPWLSNFCIPSGFAIAPFPFFWFDVPRVDPPVIQNEGDYWFAAVLTTAGVFDFVTDISMAQFHYGTAMP
jgi:hypothetical protein